MVGEPKYPPGQIYWILDNVLKKTKNDAMSQGFLETFGKTLTPTQIRYVKNKYGKDPDFNAPMINKRLEYLGPGTLNLPSGSNVTAGNSSQANASTSSHAPAPTSAAHFTPRIPSSRPRPSIEAPFITSSRYSEPHMFLGSVSPPTSSRHPASHTMFSPPSQASLSLPFDTLSPLATGGLPHPSGDVCPSPDLSHPQKTTETVPSPKQTVPLSAGIDPSAVIKRPRDTVEPPTFSPPASKRVKLESSRGPRPGSGPVPATISQNQGATFEPQEQDNTFSSTHEFFNDQFYPASAIPMLQNQSMFTTPSHKPNELWQMKSPCQSWDPYSLAEPPYVAVDPNLYHIRPTRSSFHGTPLQHHGQLPMAAVHTPTSVNSQILPLGGSETSPVMIHQAQGTIIPSPYQVNRQDPGVFTPQAYAESLPLAELLNIQETEIKKEQNQSSVSSHPPNQPASCVPRSLPAPVQNPEVTMTPDLPGEDTGPQEVPTMSPQRPPVDDIAPATQSGEGEVAGGNAESYFGLEDYLLDLEPLVWAAQTDSPENEEA